MTKPKVLFVDDEPRILDGLRRSLRGKRSDWEMSFAPGGEPALEMLAGTSYDVVVSDMRMPGIDGAELLTRVSTQYPQVARVVLSGHTEPEAAIRVAIAGHRFLTKPTETETLTGVVDQLIVKTSRAHGNQARRIAGAARALPTLPAQVAEVDAALSAQEDAGRLARAVALDTALTAKLLQLSNSAFFGARPKNAGIAAVVTAMGLPTIQALVAAAGEEWVSTTWEPEVEAYLRMSWRHSVATACLAETVASPAHRPYAHAAALLQDVGALTALAGVAGGVHSVDLTKRECAGVPFQEVGVELMHLWGLPAPVVTAIAERDTPHEPAEAGLGVSGALRVAHLLIQGTDARELPDEASEEELKALLAHPQMAARSADWAAEARLASERASEWLAA
ncbi:HDOD domain-containing protein [Actinoplanes subtropicus]|uniref:HDOD domain-containing protein n=1 Tax=Actinoplanes subtropicus TaxID=543632 RepID=UPI0004C3910C|nr:HDOD domain-containing protein [Actinoplanes subtropicus]